MRLNGLAIVLALSFFVAPLAAAAQQPKTLPRIGFLLMGSAEAGLTPAFDAFREGLREVGWTENENIAIEYRWAGDNPQRLPELAADLVRLKVDIIIGSTPGVREAQRATSEIPIIMCIADDAVKQGFVSNLARPGGNITGMAAFSEFAGKRLELLREATGASVSRVALLWNPLGSSPDYLKDTQTAARALRVTLQSVEVRTAHDFERAFASVLKGRAEALMVGPGQFLFTHQRRIVEFALQKRLPSIYAWKDPVNAGGLVAYGVNIPQAYRRAAYYVDKILRGTKPGDLPVEQPTKFDLVVNLKTAKALGLAIPQSILVRADEIIR
jgi:putative tryptophan/tyrosine transport system substrate-binding protein